MQPTYAKAAVSKAFEKFGTKAIYFPTQGQEYSIRILVKQPDREVTFHETRIINATHVFEILTETCPQPLRGDRIQLEEETFIIQHTEARDPLRLVWLVEAIKK